MEPSEEKKKRREERKKCRDKYIKRHLKSIWLASVVLITTILIVTYIVLHLQIGGKEEIYLNKDQLSAVTALITQQDSIEITEMQKDSLIYDYLINSVLVEKKDANSLLKTYNSTQLLVVLPTYPFKVKSFFWFTSKGLVLLEIVFWSLFGLIASLLYGVTLQRSFNEAMIKEHIGKFFYTPFICIVIYLSINALTNQGSITLEGIGSGTIVLSFILGFFTRRAVLLLARIKDLILPKTPDVIEADNEIRNMYPNEIKGAVTAKDLSVDDWELLRKTIKISAERNYTGEDKESYYKLEENLSKDGTFSFNSLLAGIYQIECKGTLNSKAYTSKMTIPMQDSDVPVCVDIVLDEVETTPDDPSVPKPQQSGQPGEAENQKKV